MSTADDQPVQPTEEQVSKANAAEMQRWEDDFKEEDLKVSYKNEVEDTEKTEEEEVNPPTTSEEVEEVEYTEPTPVVTAEDPGDYQPQDYSFDIEINGKTHKVDSSEKAAELADEFAEDLTAKQILQLLTKGTSIATKEERDKEKWQEKKDAFSRQSEEQAARTETIENFAKEFDYLVAKGAMPAIDSKYANADWSDPEVAKQPGVKDQMAIINYMVKENEARAKAGIRPLTSIIDAHNSWKLENGQQAAADAKREAGEQRKAAGARVAGVSSGAQQPFVPKGISVGNPNVFKRSASVWDN